MLLCYQEISTCLRVCFRRHLLWGLGSRKPRKCPRSLPTSLSGGRTALDYCYTFTVLFFQCKNKNRSKSFVFVVSCRWSGRSEQVTARRDAEDSIWLDLSLRTCRSWRGGSDKCYPPKSSRPLRFDHVTQREQPQTWSDRSLLWVNEEKCQRVVGKCLWGDQRVWKRRAVEG